mmetsp:Transcript_125350/g.297562  ORF Transcript_125350/g.297562 Transcript_125350/m.297562 type:complete len:493 (-) Transcript_125350:109-1587(-)
MLLSLIVTAAQLYHGQARSCAPLRNRDIFSTVEVQVGTPPQSFDLVADTGSNTLIVQSCVCQEVSSCPSSFGRCFRGFGKSKTFSVPRAVNTNANGDPQVWILEYGSGDIEALLASDKVSIANFSASMNNSLLLMVSQALNFNVGQFEGILGLGIPNLTVASGASRQTELTTFLEQAKVHRFSLCFNALSDGVLGLGGPSHLKSLASTSREHWALNLRNVSVAGHAVSLQDKAQVIPDSGTTLITGPQKQIAALFELICAKWQRCRKAKLDLSTLMVQAEESNSGAAWIDPSSVLHRLLKAFKTHAKRSQSPDAQLSEDGMSQASGAAALHMLLQDCNSWQHNVDLNEEMPEVVFQLEGADGAVQDIRLLPSSYVAEVSSGVMVWTRKYLMGILPYWWPEFEESASCATLFGAENYIGDEVWILGTPLFYNHRVHFNLGSPPSVAFDDEPCGNCVDGHEVAELSLTQGRGIRQVRHEPRAPWPRAYRKAKPS